MEEISLKAQQLFTIGGYNVTNGLLLTFVVSIILITLSFVISRRVSIIPGKLQAVAEMGVESLLSLWNQPWAV